MINEKMFISSHQSFWLGVAPMLSQFVKTRNPHLERITKPFNLTTGDNRGLIGELTFRLFAVSYQRSCKATELDEMEVRHCVERSVEFIQRFRAFSRQPVLHASLEGIDEASQLADRLVNFFNSEITDLKLWPVFPGCGWLDSGEGDVIGGSTLYEIKCGQSRIKGKDIKQILCYLALNYASNAYEIDRICLYNPRTGLVLRCMVDSLCRDVAGVAAPLLLGDIVEYVSEPSWTLEGV